MATDMPDKTDIKDIDDQPVGDLDKVAEMDISSKKVKYDSVLQAIRSEEKFADGLKEALRNTAVGRNTAGRAIGIALDVATIFFPYGGRIDRLRAMIKRRMGLNERSFEYTEDTMNDVSEDVKENVPEEAKKIKKWIEQDSTRSALAVLAGVLAYVGVEVDPGLVADSVSYIVQGAGLLIAGAATIYELIRDENKG